MVSYVTDGQFASSFSFFFLTWHNRLISKQRENKRYDIHSCFSSHQFIKKDVSEEQVNNAISKPFLIH